LLDTLKKLEVIARMSFDIKDKKIRKAVIKLVTVYMMNLLIRKKWATKILLHYKTMFGGLMAIAPYIAIIAVNHFTTLVGRIVLTSIKTRLLTPLGITFSATSFFRGELRRGDLNRGLAN